jgi:hypothetical protein
VFFVKIMIMMKKEIFQGVAHKVPADLRTALISGHNPA